MKKIIVIFMAFVLMFSVGCEEELVMDAVVKEKPVITDFQPKSARLGEEIEITGEFLSNVNRVYFNNDSTAVGIISQLVNDKKMIVKVAKQSLSGFITVQNTLGTSTSSVALSIDFPVPTIGVFIDSAQTYDYIEIQGSNMDAVNEVSFDTTPALIIETWQEVLVVRVPFYWNETVKINLTYNNEKIVETVTSTEDFVLVRVEPVFNDVPGFLNVEKTIKIVGENLKVIDTLFLNGNPVDILSNQDSLIQFRIPEDDFEESEEGVTISYIYNVGFQNGQLATLVKVVVPLISVWEDFKLKPRGAVDNHFGDFITGGVYDMCMEWEVLKENMSMLAYASKGGYIQFRSPHNAGTVLKNYKCDGTDASALPAEDAVRYCLMKRLQADDESNGALHAKYINLIKSGDINMVLDDPEFIDQLNEDVQAIKPNNASLSYYNEETLSGFDGVQPQVEIGDVLAITHVVPTYDENGEFVSASTKYGFIEFTNGYGDVNGTIGGKDDPDASFLQFDVYIVK